MKRLPLLNNVFEIGACIRIGYTMASTLAISLRSLIVLHAPNAVDMARFVLWRDDPALEPLIDPRWNSPRASVDFRV